MYVDKHEAETITRALNEWQQKGLLSTEQKELLEKEILPKRTDRQQVAQYFFVVAVSCAVLAFGAIFIDDKILEKLKAYFSLGNLFIAACSTLVATAWLYYVHKLKPRITNNTFEVYTAAGALLIQIAVLYTCKETGYGKSNNGLLLASSISLFALSLLMHSRVVWLGALLALAAWFAAFTTWTGNDYMFLGMNYPLRMTIFGGMIYALSFVQNRIPALVFTRHITNVTGLLLLFTGMWAVSVFGNYGHLNEWAKVRQTQVLIYSLAFGVASMIALYFGVKRKDDVLRDVSVLFLLINLYTRYFEFFWDHTNKGVFFLILAVSFYIVGRWLNKRKKTSVDQAV